MAEVKVSDEEARTPEGAEILSNQQRMEAGIMAQPLKGPRMLHMVEFIKHVLPYAKGERASFQVEQAKKLVRERKVKLVDQPYEFKPTPPSQEPLLNANTDPRMAQAIKNVSRQ